MGFAHDLLGKTGVAVAPGIDFDTEVGHRYIRLSFAGPRDDVVTGLDRLAAFLTPTR
jgi:aspartate/methionine/tyrosine aminotransferase